VLTAVTQRAFLFLRDGNQAVRNGVKNMNGTTSQIGKRVSYVPVFDGKPRAPQSLGIVTSMYELGHLIAVECIKGGLRSMFTMRQDDKRWSFAQPNCFDRV